MTTMIGGAPISSILATNVSWYGLTNSSAQYYTGEEQSQLIRKCYETFLTIGNTAYLAIIMCFCLGLRIGELVALKVSDFDFEAGVVPEPLVHRSGTVFIEARGPFFRRSYPHLSVA